MSQTTTSDVRKQFRHLNTVEFFRTLRTNDWEDATTRRLGDTLVAHIPAESESGLGKLFG